MNDYNYCYVKTTPDPRLAGRPGYEPVEHFSSERAVQNHMASRLYVTDELAKPFDGKTVVVTHHAPSGQSVHARYGNDALNPAYASRLEPLMLEHEPVLWTHGHTHTNFDYMIGNTRVVCNPRGYEGHELNTGFIPDLVIEI